jgi:hypothetical protein
MTIQQNGNQLSVSFPIYYPRFSGVGTISGQAVAFTTTLTDSSGTCSVVSDEFSGSILAPNQMGGKENTQCAASSGNVLGTITADWTAARTSP